MLKAVAMALPTYTMACFLIPKTICKQIMALMSTFWWRNKMESKGMYWKSWDCLCKPKASGGLGFKDLEAFNLALLGKQLWRMLTNKDSLMTKVFKSRYFRDYDPLNAPLGCRPSYAWRSIHTAQKLVQQGARVIVGNGRSTKVWQERWIGKAPATKITTMRLVNNENRVRVTLDMRVSDLLCGDGRVWNQELLERLFIEKDQVKIKTIRPVGPRSEDTYSWEYTKTWHYTVKSAYWVQVNVLSVEKEKQEVLQPNLDAIYQKVWSLNISPKVKHFIWRCLNNAFPVAANMVHRHIAKDNRCNRCGEAAESVNHVLFQCHYARLIWAEANVHIPPAGVWSDSLFSNIHWVLNLKKEK